MTTTPGTASYRAYAGEDVITGEGVAVELPVARVPHRICLLYTSDAADERSRVDLGGCRIIKKKNKQ